MSPASGCAACRSDTTSAGAAAAPGRRRLLGATLIWVTLPAAARLGFAEVDEPDVATGLRLVLEAGVMRSAADVRDAGGFLASRALRLGLPPELKDAENALRAHGSGVVADALIDAINRTADFALPLAHQPVAKAAQRLSIRDPRALVTGGQDAATQYFKARTRESLARDIGHAVHRSAMRAKLPEAYRAFAAAVPQGTPGTNATRLEGYIALKVLDAIYVSVAAEEASVRADPLAQKSELIRRAFGAGK